MQLYASVNYATGLFSIQGNVQSINVKNPLIRIPFLIDTTSPYTSISLNDANVIGVDFSQLTEGIIDGNNNQTKMIPNCGIFFLPNKYTGILEYFDQIAVQDIRPRNTKEHDVISKMPSILGQDFLSRYRIILQYPYMILEK
ncbi:MAG: retroviral-like aspartic protease family protein [Candidatus Nitrosocosmicus sp.]|nr:retroviral-like aspartic protease family protein [Candidatus Nitrosocosmicus sp.]